MLMSTLPTPTRPQALNTTSAGAEAPAFECFLGELLLNTKNWQIDRDYSLDLGVDEKALERYASGACSLYEREEIHQVLSKSKWAMNYVTNLVKSQRRLRSP